MTNKNASISLIDLSGAVPGTVRVTAVTEWVIGGKKRGSADAARGKFNIKNAAAIDFYRIDFTRYFGDLKTSSK